MNSPRKAPRAAPADGGFAFPPAVRPEPTVLPAGRAALSANLQAAKRYGQLYLCHFVKKISSRGSAQDRVWILVPRHMCLCDLSGNIRRALRLCHIERVFVQYRPDGAPLLAIKSCAVAGEPTVLLRLAPHPDNHWKSREDPLWPLYVLNAMRRPLANADVAVTVLPPEPDLLKPAARDKAQQDLGEFNKKRVPHYLAVPEKMRRWELEREPEARSIPGYRSPEAAAREARAESPRAEESRSPSARSPARSAPSPVAQRGDSSSSGAPQSPCYGDDGGLHEAQRYSDNGGTQLSDTSDDTGRPGAADRLTRERGLRQEAERRARAAEVTAQLLAQQLAEHYGASSPQRAAQAADRPRRLEVLRARATGLRLRRRLCAAGRCDSPSAPYCSATGEEHPPARQALLELAAGGVVLRAAAQCAEGEAEWDLRGGTLLPWPQQGGGEVTGTLSASVRGGAGDSLGALQCAVPLAALCPGGGAHSAPELWDPGLPLRRPGEGIAAGQPVLRLCARVVALPVPRSSQASRADGSTCSPAQQPTDPGAPSGADSPEPSLSGGSPLSAGWIPPPPRRPEPPASGSGGGETPPPPMRLSQVVMATARLSEELAAAFSRRSPREASPAATAFSHPAPQAGGGGSPHAVLSPPRLPGRAMQLRQLESSAPLGSLVVTVSAAAESPTAFRPPPSPQQQQGDGAPVPPAPYGAPRSPAACPRRVLQSPQRAQPADVHGGGGGPPPREQPQGVGGGMRLAVRSALPQHIRYGAAAG